MRDHASGNFARPLERKSANLMNQLFDVVLVVKRLAHRVSAPPANSPGTPGFAFLNVRRIFQKDMGQIGRRGAAKDSAAIAEFAQER